MKRSILFLLIVLLCTIYFTSNAQVDEVLKIGQWKAHLSSQHGRYVTQSEDKIYYATDWALIEFDKASSEINFIDKINQLSDVGVGVIRYANEQKKLIVTYDNSNIDLIDIDHKNTTNLPFIARDNNIIGDRKIYDIYVYQNKAYLSCGFGVVEMDLDREEFGFTLKTGIKINRISIFEGFIYAATDEGIYRSPYNNTNNLADFNNWELLGAAAGFPADYTARDLTVYQDKLYLAANDSLFQWKNESLTYVYHDPQRAINFLSAEGAHLLVGFAFCADNSCRGAVLAFDENQSTTAIAESCVDLPLYAIEDERSQVWLCDTYRRFRQTYGNLSGCNTLTFDSPPTHWVNRIAVEEGQVWISSGGIKPNQNRLARADGFYALVNNEWKRYSRFNDDSLLVAQAEDFYDIAVHPTNGKVYTGSFNAGLIELDKGIIQVYNQNNSILKEAFGVKVSGLAFDENNTLWLSNHGVTNPIYALRSTGEWYNFDLDCGFTEALDIAIDQNGYKWIIDGSDGGGLLVFDEGDLDNPNDDRCRQIRSSNSTLSSNTVLSIAVDLDGDVWVGTAEGVVIFECGSGVFDDQCIGSRRIVAQDGFNAFLLETEEVAAIAIDGANRKWFGTSNGVFVQSANGEKQIAFFNEENSPLFDNNISDIAINQENGEVFIGTNRGLISYRSDAVEGKVLNEEEAHVFPNPVRPDYDGPIAIKGLARDANVKITDATGQLVFETTALGGQAIWDGKDYNGRKASSGVYLVFSTSTKNPDTPDAIVSKILFLN